MQDQLTGIDACRIGIVASKRQPGVVAAELALPTLMGFACCVGGANRTGPGSVAAFPRQYDETWNGSAGTPGRRTAPAPD